MTSCAIIRCMNDTQRKPGKPKGLPKSGGGSRKGVPNKSTALAREAIATFVDNNAERLQGWLDEIADDPKHGPKGAFEAFLSLVEYHVPKLARTEHTGANGGAIESSVTLNVVGVAPPKQE